MSSIIKMPGATLLAAFCISTLAGCERPAASQGNPPSATTNSADHAPSPAAAGASNHSHVAARPVTFSSSELAGVIDFGKLPRLSGTKVAIDGAAHFSAKVPGKVPEVAAFYFDVLAKLGWKSENAGDDQSPRADSASAILVKDGYMVSLALYKAGEPSTTSLDFVALGNFDTRKLPRVNGAEKPYESQISTIYFVPTKVPAAAEEVLKLLDADGWRRYAGINSSNAVETESMRTMKLRKRGYSLDLSIYSAPAENNETTVEYSVRALSHELPAPPDAIDIQFDDDRCELRCVAPNDLKSVADFYRRMMPELGYEPLKGEHPDDTHMNLRFASQRDGIVIRVESKSGKTSAVLITPGEKK